MSARAVECVLAHSKVDGSARALLLVLAWRSWDDSGCWTASLSDIAALVGINRRNTRIAIAKARSQTELAGEVGTGRGHVSRYEVRCGLTGQLAVKCDGKRVGSDPVIPRKKVGTNAITQAERGSVPTERGSLLSVERAPKPSKQNDGKEKVLKERVPSRARAREETASTPVLEIKNRDPRYPLARLLHDRFRWKRITPKEWEDFEGAVNNEYPPGTQEGRDRYVAWLWLADWLAALPPDVKDAKRAFFDWYDDMKDRREAAAAVEEAESNAHKRAVLHPSIAALAVAPQEGDST